MSGKVKILSKVLFCFITGGFLLGGFAGADPLVILDKFHKQKTPEKKSIEKPSANIPEPSKDKSKPSEIIDNFHKRPKPLKEEEAQPDGDVSPTTFPAPSESESESESENENGKPEAQDKVIITIPFYLGHNPSSYQRAWLSADGKDYWLGFNLQLTQKEFEKIPVLKDYLSGLSLLDPKFEGGVQYKISNEEYWFSAGASLGFKKGPVQGLKFKALVYASAYEAVLQSSKGRVAAYYHIDKIMLFKDGDFAAFYAGWVSPALSVNLSNIDDFKANFRNLKSHYENVTLGFFYLPDLSSNFSYNVEISPGLYSLSINYLF